MIDPYARVNERIRDKRRAQGRRDDEYDALIRAASLELGAVTEAAIGLFIDLAERVGLRSLEDAARTGAAHRLRWAPEAVRAARFASSRLPGAGGRAVSTSSEWAIRTGFSILRDVRRYLESTRRGAGSAYNRPRRQPPPTPQPSRSSASRATGRRGRPDTATGPVSRRTKGRTKHRPEGRRG